jgi:hypothetical protein
VLHESSKQAVNLSVHQDEGHHITGIPEIRNAEASIAEIEYHAFTIKYSKAASVVQKECKMLSDIENCARCIPSKVGESSEWTSIVNSVEENRTGFYKSLDGKLLFRTLCGMYTVTLNELRPS